MRVCQCGRPNEITDADGVRYCVDCGERLRPSASPALAELADLVVQGVAERVAALVADGSAEGWISVQEAAQHLACKPQRVYDLVHRQKRNGIPVKREGGRLLFRRSELDEWLARRNAP